MTRSDSESYAIACPYRAGGAMAGDMSVHVLVLKSYAQVSLSKSKTPALLDPPPNKTKRPDWESYAMACPYRAGGVGSVPPVPTGARGIGAACQSLGREAMGSPRDASSVQILSDASLSTPIAT